MSTSAENLIDGYLDDQLSVSELLELQDWLKADAQHAKQFAAAVMLHDRLRSVLADVEDNEPVSRPAVRRPIHFTRSFFTIATTACLLLITATMLWLGGSSNSASAAAFELKRIIIASAQSIDRTYSIAVEEVALSGSPHRAPDGGPRPPKVPLSDAILHVRGAKQFVLIRKIKEGSRFITGSNGETSWAVRPEGPVRVSKDPAHFSRDVPGHEHAMPLNNLHDGLEQLQVAYDIQLLPVESTDVDEVKSRSPSRLMIAVKKQGFRGPKRVEITYAVATGLIQQLRFIEMPYGPEKITLRMTIIGEEPLGAEFFEHTSHHTVDRTIEFEE